jgi:hypothetical protein
MASRSGPVETSLFYLRSETPAIVDGGKDFGPVEKLGRALWRLENTGVMSEEEGMALASVWTYPHDLTLKKFMESSDRVTGPSLFERIVSKGLPAAGLPGSGAGPAILGTSYKGLIITKEEELDLRPRSEHSPEADLERALEHQAFVTDPEYGSW